MHHHHLRHHHADHVNVEVRSEQDVAPLPFVVTGNTVKMLPHLESRLDIAPPSRALVARETSTCAPGNDSGSCQKPTDVSNTTIILGVVIPIAIAAVVLGILHRRHKKKLRLEDLDDKHKSLDFGLGLGNGARGKKGKPPPLDFEDPEKPRRSGKGLSMDMLNSPYLLPAALHESRESFHSLSRSANDGSDPYRPVTFAKSDDYGRGMGEQASIYTKSSAGTDSTNLLRHANPPAMSYPSRGNSSTRSESDSPQDPLPPQIKFPERSFQPSNPSMRDTSPLNPASSSGLSPGLSLGDRDSYFDKNASDIRENNDYLASVLANKDSLQALPRQISPNQEFPLAPPSPSQQPIRAPEKAVMSSIPQIQIEEKYEPPSPPRVNGLPSNPRPARLQSMEASVHHAHTASIVSDTSDYGDGIKVTPPSPPPPQDYRKSMVQRHSFDGQSFDFREEPEHPPIPTGLTIKDLSHDPKRLSIRPLPIEDPTDNPEQRANRIRSFYKEYFDDSKPDPVGQYGYDDYVEDYGAEYLAGSAYEPQHGDRIHGGQHTHGAPYGRAHYDEAQYDEAQYDGAPYDRAPNNRAQNGRAPYGGAPYGGAPHGADPYGRPPMPFAQPMARRAMTPPPRAPPSFKSGRSSQHSTASTNRYIPSRGQSAMSARSGPRRPLPPPEVLTSLPTPHKLKEDAMVFNPLDFAPPSTYRDRQAGRRPDSPLGTARPYSPAVRAHVPLESSFAELAPMPSPHMLRKSGTFTALDFAPPGRFKTSDAGSDAASIRSYGSGMSQMQLHSLRAGAYRVSRIPREVVGTRDDIITSLKPKWDLVAPA